MKAKSIAMKIIWIAIILAIAVPWSAIPVQAANKVIGISPIKRDAGIPLDTYAVAEMIIEHYKDPRSVTQVELQAMVNSVIENIDEDWDALHLIDDLMRVYGIPASRQFINSGAALEMVIRQSVDAGLPTVLIGNGHQVVVDGYRDGPFQIHVLNPDPNDTVDPWRSFSGLWLSNPYMLIAEVITLKQTVLINTEDYGALTYNTVSNVLSGGTPPTEPRLIEAIKSIAPYANPTDTIVIHDRGNGMGNLGTYILIVRAGQDIRLAHEFGPLHDWYTNIVDDSDIFPVFPLDPNGFLDTTEISNDNRNLSLFFRVPPSTVFNFDFRYIDEDLEQDLEQVFSGFWFQHITFVRETYYYDVVSNIVSRNNAKLFGNDEQHEQTFYDVFVESLPVVAKIPAGAGITADVLKSVNIQWLWEISFEHFLEIPSYSVADAVNQANRSVGTFKAMRKFLDRLPQGFELDIVGDVFGKLLEAITPIYYAEETLNELTLVRDHLENTGDYPQLVTAMSDVISDMSDNTSPFWDTMATYFTSEEFLIDVAEAELIEVGEIVGAHMAAHGLPILGQIYTGVKLGLVLANLLWRFDETDEKLRQAVVAKDIANILFQESRSIRETLWDRWNNGTDVPLEDIKTWDAYYYLLLCSETYALHSAAEGYYVQDAPIAPMLLLQLLRSLFGKAQARDVAEMFDQMAESSALAVNYWAETPSLELINTRTNYYIWDHNIDTVTAGITSIDGINPPLFQQHVDGIVSVDYIVNGISGPFDVTLWIDGMPWYRQFSISAGTYTYNWNTNDFHDGESHYLRLEATDSNGDTISDYRSVIVGDTSNVAPTINLLTPDNDLAFRYYRIDWTDYDPDDNAIITLGYDNNNAGCDGTEIQNWISEDWNTDYWYWRDIPGTSGTQYWVYALIEDDLHEALCTYSPGKLTIETPTSGNAFSFDHLEVDDEEFGNGNGIWEAGESIDLDVYITNNSGNSLSDVSAVIDPLDDRIVLNDEDTTYYAFSTGETHGVADHFELTIGPGWSGLVSTQMDIFYRENGGALKKDTETFNLEVYSAGAAPYFTISNITYLDNDLTEADGDGIPESGEDNIYTSIQLENIGSAPATNIQGIITQPDGWTRFWGSNDRDYPDIPTGGSAWPETPYRIDDIPANFSGQVNSTLTIYYGTDHQFSAQVNVPVTIQPTPRIRVLDNYYAFGLVNPGTIVTHDFDIENIGSSTANISSITGSHPDLSFTNVPTSIPPGETATFTVAFDTTGLDASVVRTFTINSNAHLLSRNTGTLSGTVHEVMSATYDMLLDQPMEHEPNHIGTGDTDGDGLLEIILDEYVWDASGNDYTIINLLEQTAPGSTSFTSVWNSGTSIIGYVADYGSMQVGDVNNDGREDVVIATYSDPYGTPTGHLYYLTSNGNNSLSLTVVSTTTSYRFTTLAISDSDSDGIKEIIVGRLNTSTPISNVMVYEYTNGTSFSLRWTSPFISEPGDPVDEARVCGLDSSDSDQDGHAEVLLGTNLGQVEIYESTGNNSYDNTPRLNVVVEDNVGGSYDWCDLIVYDSDNDNIPNIIYGNEDAEKLWIYESTGNNAWGLTWSEVVAPTADIYRLEAGDTDLDGNPDIVITYRSPDGVTIYETFANNSYAQAYRSEDSALVPDTATDVAIKNIDSDPFPEILFSSEYYGYWVWQLNIPRDLLINDWDIQLYPQNPTEADTVVITSTIINNSQIPINYVAVSIFNGDPNQGGSLLDSQIITAIPAGGVGQVEYERIFTTAGLYDIYIVVDPANEVAEIYEGNNQANISITVSDDDTTPPDILNVSVNESTGDGDSLLEDDELVLISWTTTDMFGIENTFLTCDCPVGSVTSLGDAYQVIVGPCNVGNHDFEIVSTDADNSPLTNSVIGSFDVFYHEPQIVMVTPMPGAVDIPRATLIQVYFGTEMNWASINASTFILNTITGEPIIGTISYYDNSSMALFTPDIPLLYSTTYRATLLGGTSGISDIHGNTLASDFNWTFTTISDNPPGYPINSYPSNGSVDINPDLTLSWSASDPENDILTFDVYLDVNNPPLQLRCSGTFAFSCNPGPLNWGTTYYWRVVASDGLLTTTGDIWTFTTLPPDLVPPKITLVGTTEDTGDGSLDPGEYTSALITQFRIYFNENVYDPIGHELSNDVTNPENYLLVNDGGDTFETNSCLSGVLGNDIPIPINYVVYNSIDEASLTVNNSNHLPAASYRLIVCGSTSIEDIAGNKLDGNSDGIGGDDYILDFMIEPLLQFEISETSVDEGEATVVLTATLNLSSTEVVTVDYASADGTATTGNDYLPAGGTLIFQPGETSQTITITLLDDAIDEDDEMLTISLSNPTNVSLGIPSTTTLTILDNDAPPQVQMSSSEHTGGEASGSIVVTVNLSAMSGKTITVGYASADGTATTGNDYLPARGTLTFQPGETSQTITITLLDDITNEADETFTISLSDPMNASLGTLYVTVLVIIDNEEMLTFKLYLPIALTSYYEVISSNTRKVGAPR